MLNSLVNVIAISICPDSLKKLLGSRVNYDILQSSYVPRKAPIQKKLKNLKPGEWLQKGFIMLVPGCSNFQLEPFLATFLMTLKVSIPVTLILPVFSLLN